MKGVERDLEIAGQCSKNRESYAQHLLEKQHIFSHPDVTKMQKK